MEQDNITLSICMIVKNEERCLERCLKSLIPLREKINCEIIVTDTGSTDNSIEIAKKYADKLLYFEWCNDFAAARNVGLEQARGKWIMSIDADEELTEDISELVTFFTNEENYRYNGCLVKLKNCISAEMCKQCQSLREYTGPSGYFTPYRIFRADLKPRFQGIIHEAVAMMKPLYTFENIVLYHDGYAYEDKSKREQKGQRNASLLEKEIKQNIHDLRAITHILREEGSLKKEVYENLIALTEKLMYKQKRNMFVPYSFAKVADYYSQNGKHEKALTICQDYIKQFTDNNKNNIYQLFEMDIRFIQSKCLFVLKQYQLALKMIERYLYLIDKYEKQELPLDLLKTASPMHVQQGAKEYIQSLQVRCYIELNDFKKAGECIKQFHFEKATSGGFHNFFMSLIRIQHISEANISLAEYYPILSRAMKHENKDLQNSAKDIFDMLQRYIKNLPAHLKEHILKQISCSEEGRQDLKELEEKQQQERQKAKQQLDKVIEDTKKTIKDLIEQDMKDKALDLVMQIQKIMPEDMEIKELMKTLSK